MQRAPAFARHSTGIKIYGEGEWLDQKHGVRSCRRWRKLHLAVDANTHEIAAVELTPDDVGDVSAVAALLDQIEGSVGSMTGDGAYDGQAVYDEVAKRHPEAAVIIPPRSTAISSETASTQRTSISRRSQGMGVLAGSGVPDIPGGASLKLRCTDTRPYPWECRPKSDKKRYRANLLKEI